jgi:fimbrial isopeptide formation D2 family protein
VFSSPRLLLPRLRTRFVTLSLGLTALLSICAFNAQAQQLSIPGLRAPEKSPSTNKKLPAAVRAARGEAPLSRLYDYAQVEQSKIRRLPALDPRAIREEESKKKLRIGVVRTFSRPVKVSSDSTLRRIAEGDVRVIGLVSEGALYTRVHFTGMSLPAGARVFVYSLKNPEEFYGPYVGRGPSVDGTFWTPPVKGDSVAIEYFTPTGVSDSANTPFQVPEISHIYRSLFTTENSFNSEAGSCNLDVTGEWAEVAKSVGHLQFTSHGAEYTCTGTLLNNPSNDQTPYLLTANHCFNTQTEAQSLRVYWFYNTGDTPAFDTPHTDGANLLASSTGSDFTLVRLTGSLPGGLFFSGWDATPTPLSTSVTGIHHPEGSHKRISFGDTISGCGGGLPGICQNYTNVHWNNGTTEPGSSGSGIWKGTPSDPRLVGTLTGGGASCDNLSGTDYYGSFSATYPHISWLLTGEVGDLAITKTTAYDQVAPGSKVVYFITVTNNVGVTVNTVTINDNLPAGLTFDGCNAFTNGGTCTGAGNNRTVTFANLAAGKSATVVIGATVDSSIAPGTVISNTATVSSSSPEMNMSNNAATATIFVNPTPLKPSGNGKIAFGSDRAAGTQPSGFYTINANGTSESLLFGMEPFASAPAWSPDGTKIAYGKRNYGTYGDEIYVANADGTGSVKVAGNVFSGNSRIAWSPDGLKLAFIGTGTSVHIVNADGTGLSRIPGIPQAANDLSWSPDGSKFAYSNNSDISTIDIATADKTLITHTRPSINGEPGRSILPRWSPDGTRIIFGVETNNYKNIFVANADGTGMAPLITLHQSMQPGWSPDGTKVTFIALNSLYVANADGTGATQITNNSFYNFKPDWQPVANTTSTPINLVLDTSGSAANQAAALDSLLFLRDPFPVVNAANLLNQASDKNTRVILFVTNLQLAQGELSSSVIVNLLGSNNQSYEVGAEDVRTVPNLSFIQIVFRLPDNLAPGTYTIKVKARGQESNSGTIRIKS